VLGLRSRNGLRQALARYYQTYEEVPDSLADAGVSPQQAAALMFDSEDMSLTAMTVHGQLQMQPMLGEGGKVIWHCSADGAAQQYLPESCKSE
jgi:hypothetical protein